MEYTKEQTLEFLRSIATLAVMAQEKIAESKWEDCFDTLTQIDDDLRRAAMFIDKTLQELADG